MASRNPINDNEIPSVDYQKLVERITSSRPSNKQRRDNVKQELLVLGKNTLTRRVIFEKNKKYNLKELRQKNFSKVQARVLNIRGRLFGSLDKTLNNSKDDTKTEFDEALEFYSKNNINVEF